MLQVCMEIDDYDKVKNRIIIFNIKITRKKTNFIEFYVGRNKERKS